MPVDAFVADCPLPESKRARLLGFRFLQFPSKSFNFFPQGLPKIAIRFQKLQIISAIWDLSRGYGRLGQKITPKLSALSFAARSPKGVRRSPGSPRRFAARDDGRGRRSPEAAATGCRAGSMTRPARSMRRVRQDARLTTGHRPRPTTRADRLAPPSAAPAEFDSAAVNGLASFISSSLRRAPCGLIAEESKHSIDFCFAQALSLKAENNNAISALPRGLKDRHQAPD